MPIVPPLRADLPDGAMLLLTPQPPPHDLYAEYFAAGEPHVPKVRHSGGGTLTPARVLSFADEVERIHPGYFGAALHFLTTGMMHRDAMATAAAEDAAGVADAPPPKSRTLAEILANPDALRPPEVLIPRLVWRGRTTLYSALDKSGKSTLLTAGVAALTTGQPFLGEPCGPGTAVWLMAEEHVGDLARRAVRFGADPDRFHVMELPRDPQADLWDVVQALRPAVVVIDPLIRYAGDSVTDGGASAQWRPVMESILRVARECEAGVAVLHHSRKSDGRSRDSGDITAAVDMVLEQPERPVGGKQAIKVRGRWPQEDFTVVLVGDEYRLDVAGDAPSEVRVMEFLRANPGAGTSALRRGVTGNNGVIDGAVADLIRRGLVVDQGSGNHHRYRLASTPPPVDLNEYRGRVGQGAGQGEQPATLPSVTPSGQGAGRVRAGSGAGFTCPPPQPIGLRGQANENGADDLFPPPTLTPAEIAALPVEPTW